MFPKTGPRGPEKGAATLLDGADFQYSRFFDVDMSDCVANEISFCKSVLRKVNLSRSKLDLVSFKGAVLDDVDFMGATLLSAYMEEAIVRRARFEKVDFHSVWWSGAIIEGPITGVEVPIVENIDRAILCSNGVLAAGCNHDGNAAHSREGWAIHLAGDAGYRLEAQVGATTAAALIYGLSCPGVPVPNFYVSKWSAMRDMRRAAGMLR